MQANATTNPPAHQSLDSTGINGKFGDSAASCENQVIRTNDTLTMAVPAGGTLEAGSENGEKWR